jgi:hypothetical protein
MGHRKPKVRARSDWTSELISTSFALSLAWVSFDLWRRARAVKSEIAPLSLSRSGLECHIGTFAFDEFQEMESD